MAIDRRDALKSLAALAGATGISVTAVATTDASDAALVILKPARRVSRMQIENLTAWWTAACAGTPLASVKAVVLDEVDVEIVRRVSDPSTIDAADAVHGAIVQLGPWLNHHPRCARVTAARACDCGLNAELAAHRWSI